MVKMRAQDRQCRQKNRPHGGDCQQAWSPLTAVSSSDFVPHRLFLTNPFPILWKHRRHLLYIVLFGATHD
jgi:hypothetical protein